MQYCLVQVFFGIVWSATQSASIVWGLRVWIQRAIKGAYKLTLQRTATGTCYDDLFIFWELMVTALCCILRQVRRRLGGRLRYRPNRSDHTASNVLRSSSTVGFLQRHLYNVLTLTGTCVVLVRVIIHFHSALYCCCWLGLPRHAQHCLLDWCDHWLGSHHDSCLLGGGSCCLRLLLFAHRFHGTGACLGLDCLVPRGSGCFGQLEAGLHLACRTTLRRLAPRSGCPPDAFRNAKSSTRPIQQLNCLVWPASTAGRGRTTLLRGRGARKVTVRSAGLRLGSGGL